MKKIIKTMFTSNAKNVPSNAENLAFYDEESNKIIVISAKDFKNCNFTNYTIINKTAELSEYSSIKLMNLNTFISSNPHSNIETYITSAHSSKVFASFECYVLAYITLYRNYKSFETLAENNFITFIDTFIDTCISEKTDHPGTICYYSYEMHKILKLRKTVFTMFKDYLNNYNIYLAIYRNQNDYNYTDTQFRVFLKTLKAFSKAQLVAKKSLIDTFEVFNNNEIA